MSCQWREKVVLFVDDELDAGAQQEFSSHLDACPECPVAVNQQMELKKALRVAGHRFSAPPELHATVYESIHPPKSVSPLWKWALAPLSVVLLGIIGFLAIANAPGDPILSALVDTHITALASPHPVDIENSSQHVVKPWFQGKLPFSFNPPEVKDSPFVLIGGKAVYVGQKPGAELLYQAGQHRVSVFIFQAGGADSKTVLKHDRSFNINRWTEGGLEYYLVTDASQDEAGKLVSMFQQSNRQ